MNIVKRFEKPSFAVIGKEGSSDMMENSAASGEGFVQALWLDASTNFAEIAHLAKELKKAVLPVTGAPCLPSRAIFRRGRTAFRAVCT